MDKFTSPYEVCLGSLYMCIFMFECARGYRMKGSLTTATFPLAAASASF